MKKTKILVAMLAFMFGAGAAVSVNAKSSVSAISYGWIDRNG
ncbi:hypothetical protein [Chitinophaga ginsengisoli]|uniref:Uncharacterized protein n=1 Tax=Chitinophaga ginsengisoli TaxID=363837 RepID=A0A2P8GQ51_9BACT|nr:hypothetical protein [Chitinophaga ginsengisoli]PSL36096.1 hypothetical protein CLV42_101865 [Chitinophaga ginsengisoli]